MFGVPCFHCEGSAVCLCVALGGRGTAVFWPSETTGLMAGPTVTVRDWGREGEPGKENPREGIPVPVCPVSQQLWLSPECVHIHAADTKQLE